MATVTEPITLDKSINTTENPSRNIADVLAEELKGIADNILPPNASQIAYDNSGSGLVATNVQDAIDTLAEVKLLLNNNPTTANTFTEFDLDGSLSNYRFVVFLYMQYNNSRVSFVEPRVLFDTQTGSGSRVQLWFNGNLDAEIYKVSDTKVALKQTDVSGTYKVRIYGFN